MSVPQRLRLNIYTSQTKTNMDISQTRTKTSILQKLGQNIYISQIRTNNYTSQIMTLKTSQKHLHLIGYDRLKMSLHLIGLQPSQSIHVTG